MLTNDVLNEEVFSSLAVAYHRTHNIQGTNAIGQSGFKAGGGAMYGKGIYLTYSFYDQQDERMKRLYGPFIIRCKVNLANYLIFDPDIAQRVYGAKASLHSQFAYFGVPANEVERITNLTAMGYGYTSVPARSFAGWLSGKRLQRPIKGLVFTGDQDGRVIVAYEPTSVIPFAWARVINLDKTRETVRWNKIVAPPITAKPPQAMPEFERAYRFFREQGFQLRARGEKGAMLLGVRNGDYLTIAVTTHADHILVKCFCTRANPSNLPLYAEHRGWPLYYKEFPDKLPLQNIMDTVVKNHDAMKTHPQQQIAFTEALLHRLIQPGVAITHEIKPSGDYRHDNISLTAGSVTVDLNSPYQDYTSGHLRIATKPIEIRTGFGDGARRIGRPSLSFAYKLLIDTMEADHIYARLEIQWQSDLQPAFVANLTAAMGKGR